MEPSENLKDADRLYEQFCQNMKVMGVANIPSKESFLQTLKKFNELVKGHKQLLTAIGKL